MYSYFIKIKKGAELVSSLQNIATDELEMYVISWTIIWKSFILILPAIQNK